MLAARCRLRKSSPTGRKRVHEPAVLIAAIRALHARAVNAEQEAAELRKLLEEERRSSVAPASTRPLCISDEPDDRGSHAQRRDAGGLPAGA